MRCALAIPLASAMLLAPAGAAASTASIQDRGAGPRLYVEGTPDKDLIRITRDSSNAPLRVSGFGEQMQPGPGCTPSRPGEAICPAGGLVGIEVVAGAGDDTISVYSTFGIGIRIAGGDGNDAINEIAQADGYPDAVVIEGGPGDDYLGGSLEGDRLDGGPGRDQLAGDKGSDILLGGPDSDSLAAGEGKDVIQAGGGDDSVSGLLDLVGETVDCGPGLDKADEADRIDRGLGCERFKRVDHAKLIRARWLPGATRTRVVRLTTSGLVTPNVARCSGRGCPFRARRIGSGRQLDRLFRGRLLRAGARIELSFPVLAERGAGVRFVMRKSRKPRIERHCTDIKGRRASCP